MTWDKKIEDQVEKITVYRNVRCDKCDVILQPVFDPHSQGRNLQYDGALVIRLSGGYGMFFDDMDKSSSWDNLYDKILCEECAKEFITFFSSPTIIRKDIPASSDEENDLLDAVNIFAETHEWVDWLSVADRAEFLDSLLAAIKDCHLSGDDSTYEMLVKRWETSAQIMHNPELATLITADRGEDEAVPLKRPLPDREGNS